MTAYRVQKMLKVALCVAYGALTRTESRGAHFRQDFPRRNDADWLKRTLATWKSDADTLPTLGYEALDVGRMELPPGWRGYGAKDYIDHPDTPNRIAAVEALKQKMAGAPRFAVQESLMPYDALLPEQVSRPQRAHRRTARWVVGAQHSGGSRKRGGTPMSAAGPSQGANCAASVKSFPIRCVVGSAVAGARRRALRALASPRSRRRPSGGSAAAELSNEAASVGVHI